MDKNGFLEVNAGKQKHFCNKGFSLIELIIVIAIMAILVGVLAPNLLRYIKRTQIASDIQLADTVRTAVILALADPEVSTESVIYGTTGFPINEPYGVPEAFETWGDADIFEALYNDGSDTPLGRAIAETLGYPDVKSMLIPSGITSQLSLDKEARIYVNIGYPSHLGRGIDDKIYVNIQGPNHFDWDFYVCLPTCVYHDISEHPRY